MVAVRMAPALAFLFLAGLQQGFAATLARRARSGAGGNVTAEVGDGTASPWLSDTQALYSLAKRLTPTSDKFTTHGYQVMYGTFLQPLQKGGSKVKLLEIGLGCGMTYGPGASVALWRALLPKATLWFAEYDANCVQREKTAGNLDGVNIVVGDQGDEATVARWARETGGQFDVIVDDGGHHNVHIMTSFQGLWPQVRPGGLYFIEDLHVGRSPKYSSIDARDRVAVSDVIQAWIEQLTIHPKDWRSTSQQHPLPGGVAFIFCQKQACVIGKGQQ